MLPGMYSSTSAGRMIACVRAKFPTNVDLEYDQVQVRCTPEYLSTHSVLTVTTFRIQRAPYQAHLSDSHHTDSA